MITPYHPHECLVIWDGEIVGGDIFIHMDIDTLYYIATKILMRKFPWIDDVVWERRDTFEGEEYELEITPNDEFWNSDKMQQNVMLSNLNKVMRNLFLSLENPEEPIFFGGVSVASRR